MRTHIAFKEIVGESTENLTLAKRTIPQNAVSCGTLNARTAVSKTKQSVKKLTEWATGETESDRHYLSPPPMFV